MMSETRMANPARLAKRTKNDGDLQATYNYNFPFILKNGTEKMKKKPEK